MTGNRIGYSRNNKHITDVPECLAGLKLDEFFVDSASGYRNGQADMLAFAGVGDTVFIHSMAKLASSLQELQRVIDLLLAKGATAQFVEENIILRPGDDIETRYARHMLAGCVGFEIAKRAYRGTKRILTTEQVTAVNTPPPERRWLQVTA
jgi:hypothetical protein